MCTPVRVATAAICWLQYFIIVFRIPQASARLTTRASGKISTRVWSRVNRHRPFAAWEMRKMWYRWKRLFRRHAWKMGWNAVKLLFCTCAILVRSEWIFSPFQILPSGERDLCRDARRKHSSSRSQHNQAKQGVLFSQYSWDLYRSGAKQEEKCTRLRWSRLWSNNFERGRQLDSGKCSRCGNEILWD